MLGIWGPAFLHAYSVGPELQPCDLGAWRTWASGLNINEYGELCPQELRVRVEKPTCKQAEYKELGRRLCSLSRGGWCTWEGFLRKQGLEGGVQVVVSMLSDGLRGGTAAAEERKGSMFK